MAEASSGATIETKAKGIVDKIAQLAESLYDTDGKLADVIEAKQNSLEAAKTATADAEKQLEKSRMDNSTKIKALEGQAEAAKTEAAAAKTEAEAAKTEAKEAQEALKKAEQTIANKTKGWALASQNARAQDEQVNAAFTAIGKQLESLDGVSKLHAIKDKLGLEKKGGKSVKAVRGGKKMKKAKKSRARRKGKK